MHHFKTENHHLQMKYPNFIINQKVSIIVKENV